MKNKKWIFIFLLHIISISVFADNNEEKQTTKITGNVTDISGEYLIGVSIIEVGTSNGTITDIQGNFSIPITTKNPQLKFSYLGYKDEIVKVVSGTNSINVVLNEQDKELTEVVVIGYGSVERKDLTGAVGEIKMDDIMKAPIASIDQALAGRIAGMTVSSTDGQPGSDMEIVIRGGNSLTQSNSPLYVIDGFPVEDYSMSSLNPGDIKSVNVLKDASATAIYGSRGANGVIIIETNSAKGGKTEVKYESNIGFQNVTKTMDLMNPYEFVKYQLEINPTKSQKFYLDDRGMTLDDYKNTKGYDWQDLLFRTGFTQSHNVTVSGGNMQTKFYLSGSFYDYNGIIINSGYERAQGRAKLDHNISKTVRIGTNISYTNDLNFGQLASAEQNSSKSYSSYTMYQTWGFRPLFFEGEEFDPENDVIDEEANDERVNPIVSVKNEIRQKKRNTLNANGYVRFNNAKGIEFFSKVGMIRDNTRDEAFYNSKTARGYPSTTNTRGVNGSISNREAINWMNENTLMYKKTIDKKNKFDALLGYTIQGGSVAKNGYETQQIPNEDLGLNGIDEGVPVSVELTSSSNMLISYLSRLNYDYSGKYLLTFTLRADGSSKFSKTNRWGYFPSAAIAWNLKNEKFMKPVSFVNSAKVRFSIGQTGNNRIDNYGRFSTLAMSYNNYYSFDNGTPSPSVILSRMGNEALKWETTTQSDLGIDLTLFKKRINITADVYEKKTKDLLLNANIARSSGFTSVLKNIGTIQNRGLEITLSSVNVKSRNFQWNSDFNISFNNNKVLELAEGEESFLSRVSWTYNYNSTFLYMTKVGEPASTFYGVIWDGVYQYSDFDESGKLKSSIPTNGGDRNSIQPGDIKYKDINGDGIINAYDCVAIGRATPIHTGGFNNNFVYKSLSLNVFFQWSYGNDIFNANRLAFDGNAFGRNNLNQYASYANRWTPENQTNEYFRAGGQGTTGIYSSRTIEDGSFLRLKTISLEYSIPKKYIGKLGLKNLSVSASAQNLYTWTKYSGMDPEVSVRNSNLTPGFDYSAYPKSRIIQFGIKAGF